MILLYYCILLVSKDVDIHSDDVLSVSPHETSKSSMYYVLQHLKAHLANVMIKVQVDAFTLMWVGGFQLV